MGNKVDSETIANKPMTGVGILSGFGTPDNPPDYNLNRSDKKSKQDTSLDKIMELEVIESGKPNLKNTQ